MAFRGGGVFLVHKYKQMKTKTLYLLLALLLGLPFACRKESAYVPEITVNLNQAKELPLSRLAKSVRYLKLGSPERGDPAFYPLSKVILNSSRIAVLSESMNDVTCQVFLFDQTGKFLFHLDGAAEGPNSIFGVADIDMTGNELDLLNYLRKSIFKYDLNGQLLEVLPIPERFTKFKRLQKNGYAFDTDNSPSVDSGAPFAVALWKTGKKNLAGAYLNIPEHLQIGDGEDVFIQGENATLYRRKYDPYVYSVDFKNGVTPLYQFHIKDLWIDTEEYQDPLKVMEDLNRGKMVQSIYFPVQSSDKLMAFLFFSGKIFLLIAPQQGGEAQVLRITENDIDGCPIPFTFPKAFIPPSTLVFAIDPEEIKKAASSPIATNNPKNGLTGFARTLGEQSNPVLMFVELKEEVFGAKR